VPHYAPLFRSLAAKHSRSHHGSLNRARIYLPRPIGEGSITHLMRIPKFLKSQYHMLDLFPEYINSIKRLGWDKAWGPAVACIAYCVWWFRTAPPPWYVTMAFICGLILIVGYYLWRADHVRLIPQLNIAGTRLEDMPIPIDEHRADVRTFCQLVPKCLTESPVYECRGHLREVRRWNVDRWQVTSLGPLVLRWGNVADNEITLHPGAENVLNVCFITHSTRQVSPCVDADITWQAVFAAFPRQPGGVEAYQFDVCITYSHRTNGILESVKPVNVCMEFQMTNDLYHPHLEIRSKT
jgi:hypothetical protein